MRKFPLDLSKFKKMKSDENSTTLSHPDGHSITVAHKSLSPKMRTQLSKLSSVEPAAPKEAKVQKFAEGGDIPYDETPKAPSVEEMQRMTELTGDKPTEVSVDVPKEQQADASYLPPMDPNSPAAPQGDMAPGPSVPGPGMPQQAPEMGEAPMSVAQAVTPPSRGIASSEPNIMHGYAQEQQGIKEQASAEQKLSQANVNTLSQHAQKMEEATKRFMAERQDTLKEIDAIRKDIETNKVTPEHYWQNHSKLATTIGIILAGFNPTNRPNAAIELMNHNIDRDLQAQQMNLNAKNNLLSASLHKMNNMRDAMDMSRIIMTDVAATKLKLDAAKSADPMIKARALEAAGKLEQGIAPKVMELNMRRALLDEAQKGGAHGNPEGMIGVLRVANPAMAKEMEGRYVPGVGMATIPVDAKVREELSGRETLQKEVGNLRAWSQKHEGSLSPADMAYGKALAASVQDAYRRANGQGVFKESEADFVKGIVAADPTAFFNKLRVDPKYKALEDSNESALNGLKKSYGLPQANRETRLSPQQKSFLDWARANPKHPKSALILKKLGIE